MTIHPIKPRGPLCTECQIPVEKPGKCSECAYWDLQYALVMRASRARTEREGN